MSTVKSVLSGLSKKIKKFKTDFQWVHSAILSTFIKLSFVFKTFVLSITSGHLRQVLLYMHSMDYILLAIACLVIFAYFLVVCIF